MPKGICSHLCVSSQGKCFGEQSGCLSQVFGKASRQFKIWRPIHLNILSVNLDELVIEGDSAASRWKSMKTLLRQVALEINSNDERIRNLADEASGLLEYNERLSKVVNLLSDLANEEVQREISLTLNDTDSDVIVDAGEDANPNFSFMLFGEHDLPEGVSGVYEFDDVSEGVPSVYECLNNQALCSKDFLSNGAENIDIKLIRAKNDIVHKQNEEIESSEESADIYNRNNAFVDMQGLLLKTNSAQIEKEVISAQEESNLLSCGDEDDIVSQQEQGYGCSDFSDKQGKLPFDLEGGHSDV